MDRTLWCLNAGFDWANEAAKETGDTVTDDQQAVINAGAIPASLAGRSSGFVAGGRRGANYQINRVVLGIQADRQFGNPSRPAMDEPDRQSDGVHECSHV